MNGKKIAVTPSAYSYPLLIKQLLHAPLAQTARQEIVYRDVRRLTYLELRDRIGRLASALEMIGVRPGDSVGVLDWDSNRFLEAFFVIPMMGVVLQTVNVRLSPEQVAYTIDHAGSSTLLVNDEFVDLVQSILPQLSKVKRLVVLTDRKAPATGTLEFAGEYEQLLAAASPDFEFNDFDGNDRAAERRLLQPSSVGAACDGGTRRVWPCGEARQLPSRRCLYADHAHVPCSRVGLPVGGHACRRQAGLSWPLRSGAFDQADQDGRRDVHPRRANDPANAARCGRQGRCRSHRLEDGDRRVGGSEGASPGTGGP